jgi:hypothetical protein
MMNRGTLRAEKFASGFHKMGILSKLRRSNASVQTNSN